MCWFQYTKIEEKKINLIFIAFELLIYSTKKKKIYIVCNVSYITKNNLLIYI